MFLVIATFQVFAGASAALADTLEEIERSHRLVYGADMEGGGPFVYPDPENPDALKGFEVEIIKLLAADLGAKAEFSQGQWDTLFELLETKRVDIVINGYEWTEIAFGAVFGLASLLRLPASAHGAAGLEDRLVGRD